MTGFTTATMRFKGRKGFAAFLLVLAASGLTQTTVVASAQRVRMDRHIGFFARGGPATTPPHAPQGYLGVDIRDVSEEQAAALKTKAGHGAEIIHVDHDGPAGKFGLRERDVILQMNGQNVEGEDHMRRLLRETAPGKTITLLILRDGQQQTISPLMGNREDVERLAWQQHITVQDPQNAPQTASPPAPVDVPHSGFFSSPGRASRSFLGSIVSPTYTGAILETMAPQLAEFFGTQGKIGLLVRSVDANSPAATAGLHAGDVVVRVNAINIGTSSDWLRAVRDNKGKTISVVVLRDRHEQTLQMIPNSKHHSSLMPDFWPFGSSTPKAEPVVEQQACILPVHFSM